MTTILSHICSLFRPRDRESFERLFQNFRDVLEMNNRSLEIITDMGDTLGGDYLFDIQYVRRSYEELQKAVKGSLDRFDELTRSSYRGLRDRFLEIDGRITRVIEESRPLSDALIVFHEDVSGDMTRTIGGKSNNLAEIKNTLKLNVPEGFTATTYAFDTFMRHNRIFEKIRSPEDPASASYEAASQEIRELMMHGTMPADLSRAIEKAVRKIKSRCGKPCFLAVRSSAAEEDSDFSFAGQFETILNVPLETVAIEKAYRKVIASVFSEKALAYQRRFGYDAREIKMAVGFLVMVDAAVSGVVHTADPEGNRNTMIMNAAWGLGLSIVEGRTDADLYRVKKHDQPGSPEIKTGAKETMVVPLTSGGITTAATPEEKRNQPSLAPAQIAELRRLALLLEKHFKRPQDIEWAIDSQGRIFILQSRPLRVSHDVDTNTNALNIVSLRGAKRRSNPDSNSEIAALPAVARNDYGTSEENVIVKNLGIAVQKGAASGRVFILRNEQDLDSVPHGAILVARKDSSHFVRIMTAVSAILTDTGTPTGHMAALCREFKIPTVVNAGNATRILEQGMEVTLEVSSEGGTLYEGRVRQITERAASDSAGMENILEFRKKRYLLRYIAPLNLIDPLRDQFTPDACRTMHDILRFIHEKSVAELIENAGRVKGGAVKLDLPIPADITIIDIGGGLTNAEAGHAAPDQITSLPLRAIIAGMTRPGVWRSDPVSLNMNDFMTSMLRVPDITSTPGGRVERNLAVISREYANISLKFGYHFIILDCYCSENTRNNHIYFRFAGGATDMTKRSRRLQLIAAILKEYGFNIKTKGDLIVARLANIPQAEIQNLLDLLGRLFSYTRQLDALLHDDQSVERYIRSFLEENQQARTDALTP